MKIEPLHLDKCEAVAAFLTRCRQEEARQDPLLWLHPQLEAGLCRRLKNHLFDPDEKIWVASDSNGLILGVLGVRAKELAPEDSRRTYLPPIYAILPVVTMGVQPGCWETVLPKLWESVQEWLLWRRVTRPQVWLNRVNEEAFQSWSRLKFDWLMDNAIRQITPEDLYNANQVSELIIRPATLRDISRLLPLYIEELEFHAALPDGYWLPANTDTPRFARREIESFLTAGSQYTYVVAEEVKTGELLGYISATYAPPLPENPNLLFSPPDRGVLQVAVVKKENRGQGIGTLLLRYILAWFYRNGMRSVTLSYDIRNPLSGTFWRKQNFVPTRRALICKEF